MTEIRTLHPRSRVPAAPARLSAAERAEWQRTVTNLARVGMLAFVKRGDLIRYVKRFARWHWLGAEINALRELLAQLDGFVRTLDDQKERAVLLDARLRLTHLRDARIDESRQLSLATLLFCSRHRLTPRSRRENPR